MRMMENQSQAQASAPRHCIARATAMTASVAQKAANPSLIAANASQHDESYWDAVARLEVFDPLE
jgi:hypothetical protein